MFGINLLCCACTGYLMFPGDGSFGAMIGSGFWVVGTLVKAWNE